MDYSRLRRVNKPKRLTASWQNTNPRTSEVTLNLGQTKLFNIYDEHNSCYINEYATYIGAYEWKTQNENIVTLNVTKDDTGELCIGLIPVSKGQTIVTGKSEYLNDFVKIIVTVEER